MNFRNKPRASNLDHKSTRHSNYLQDWPRKRNAENNYVDEQDSRKFSLYQNKNNSSKSILKSLPNFLINRKSDYSKKKKNGNAEESYNILYSNAISRSFCEKQAKLSKKTNMSSYSFKPNFQQSQQKILSKHKNGIELKPFFEQKQSKNIKDFRQKLKDICQNQFRISKINLGFPSYDIQNTEKMNKTYTK